MFGEVGGSTTIATCRGTKACAGGFNSTGTILNTSPGLAGKMEDTWFVSLHGLPANCKTVNKVSTFAFEK